MSSIASFQPTTNELALSNQIFLLADLQKLGIVTGDAAIKVFGGAGLPNVQLGEIWALADPDNNGFLTRKGVAVALRLIGWAQKGETPSAALLAKPGPIAQIDGVSSSLPKPASPAPRSPQLTGSLPASSSALHPPLLPQDRAKFIKLFNGSGPVSGVLAGDKAREIFLKSKLPYEKLSQIWNLADTRSRGALDSTDFIIAMYLIQASMSNQLPVLPPTLPAGLYEAASGGVASHSTGTSSLGAASPTAPAFRPAVQPPPPKPILRNTTGSRPPPPPIPARSAFPLAQQQQQQPQPPHWDVTPQEKAQFDAFFDQLDTQKTGFAGGDVVGPFLQESTLPDDALAQIWDLVDSRGEGRLNREQFAVVMHVINNKLAGKDVPAVLPPSLVPPSMRVASLGASAFGQAAFQHQHQQQPIQPPQPQKDLFSLDDTPPPSAVQPPVQPQFTGALAQQMTGQSLPRQTTGPQQPSAFGAPSNFGTPAAASSPFGQPAFTPQAQTSPFGQPAADPYAAFNQLQQQHRPAPPPPQSQPHKDLLGDEEDEAAAAAAAQNLQTSTEIGNIQNQLSSTNRTLETTRQDRESLEKSIEANASQLAALQTQLASAKASYETESKLLASFREKYAEQTKDISKTREELIAAESDLSAVKLEKTEVGGAALRDKDEVRALQKRMKEVGDEVDALKAELEKAKKDARQQKGLLAIAKKQLAAAEENRARAAKELEEAQAEVAADKAELDDVNQAIEKLNAAAAVAPIPAAAAPKPAIAQMPVEEAAIPLPPTATGTPVPAPAGKSLNPFEKLARQDSVSGAGTPPRVMSPFGSLPFTAAAIPTPPIGPAAASPPPVATQMTGASVIVSEPAPMSAAGDDPFGLDKFDEVFSTPTENIASPLAHSPPPGLDSFAAAAAATPSAPSPAPVLPPGLEDQTATQEPEAAAATAFPPVEAVAAPTPAAKKATSDELPPLTEIEAHDDDSSSDEEETSEKFTHITKPSDSDDWASAKEHGAEATVTQGNGEASKAPTFDDLFGAPSPVAETVVSAAPARPKSPTSGASSPRRPVSMLSPRSLSPSSMQGAKDPFGAPQGFDSTPFEPPVGEFIPPPIIETVLEPSPMPVEAANTSGVSDFDEAMGRLPTSSVEPAAQFSTSFDDNFDFGSATAFAPAPAPAPEPAAPVPATNGAPANKVAGFDDVFGLNGSTPDAAVSFPSVGSPLSAPAPAVENKTGAAQPSFDDVFGMADAGPKEQPAAKANGHAPTDSMSTVETASAPPSQAHGSAVPQRPMSPSASGGIKTPPRQSSPPPPAITRSTSMKFRSSSPKPKEKSKAKDSPESSSGPRHSKLSLSFFGRGNKSKDKKEKSKKEAAQHLAPPRDEAPDGAVTPAADDDSDAVKQLCVMGFSRTQAVAALEKHGYDVQLALNSLLQ